MARTSPKRTKRSPGRPKRSPGRPKRSPGRPKRSPGRPKRSPGRPKRSPGRPKKSPVKKRSPGRPKKSPVKKRSPGRPKKSPKAEDLKYIRKSFFSKDDYQKLLEQIEPPEYRDAVVEGLTKIQKMDDLDLKISQFKKLIIAVNNKNNLIRLAYDRTRTCVNPGDCKEKYVAGFTNPVREMAKKLIRQRSILKETKGEITAEKEAYQKYLETKCEVGKIVKISQTSDRHKGFEGCLAKIIDIGYGGGSYEERKAGEGRLYGNFCRVEITEGPFEGETFDLDEQDRITEVKQRSGGRYKTKGESNRKQRAQYTYDKKEEAAYSRFSRASKAIDDRKERAILSGQYKKAYGEAQLDRQKTLENKYQGYLDKELKRYEDDIDKLQAAKTKLKAQYDKLPYFGEFQKKKELERKIKLTQEQIAKLERAKKQINDKRK